MRESAATGFRRDTMRSCWNLTLREATSLLARLVMDPASLAARVFPLVEEAEKKEGWYVAHSHETPDGSCSLQVFVWPPGTRTGYTITLLGEPSAARSDL
jgi:hypothetical protein